MATSQIKRARSHQDNVRRRKWVRTRHPCPPSLEDPTRPLFLFWDVKSMENGGRLAVVRSNLQIANNMPFPLMISLSNSAWEREEEFGPIAEGDVFGVPILYAYATGIKFKPADMSCDWSATLSCSMQARNFKRFIEVVCGASAKSKPVCMRIISTQEEKSILITVVPYMVITNRLPCSFKYRVFSSQESVDEGVLDPGVSSKLAHIDLTHAPKVSFQFGDYQWSRSKIVNVDKSRKSLIEMYEQGSDTVGLVLTVSARRGKSHSMEVDVYSRGAVVDTTGLRVQIISKGKNQSYDVLRKTFDEANPTYANQAQESAAQDNVVSKDAFTSLVFPSEEYALEYSKTGDMVYGGITNVSWKYLPPLLNGQLSIKAPDGDKNKRAKNSI